MHKEVNSKWIIGILAIVVLVVVLVYMRVGQLPAPLAKHSSSLVAVPTVALTGASSFGGWPNSDSRLDFLGDLDSHILGNAGYTANAANGHVITSIKVDPTGPTAPAIAQQLLSQYLQANPGTPIGRYISGGDCLLSAAIAIYPANAIACEDLEAALGDNPPENYKFPYTGSNTYGGRRYTVNIAIPEVRTAFANLIAAEGNQLGLPLLYVDNIMHPSTGGLSGTSITFDNILQLLSSIRSQISGHGTKLVINIALSPGDLLDTPAYAPHIAALQNVVDGMSFEAPLHPYYKDKPTGIAHEVEVIRRWLSAGKLILFVNGYNPGELGELKFEAGYSLMIRRPGDSIFTGRLYWRPQSDFEWLDWSARLGTPLSDYEFVTTSPVLMKRVFQNGTLTLDPVARQVSIQWNEPPQPANNNNNNPPPNNNNQNNNNNNQNQPTTVDTTAPTVTITAPSGDTTLVGTVSFTAEASDNKAVTKVVFYVDGRSVGTDTTAPYSLTNRLNTKNLAKGSHELSVKAHDARNNIGTAAITVMVDNTGAVAPVTAPRTKAEVLQRVAAIINQLVAYLNDAKRNGVRVDFNRVDFLIRTIVNLLNQLRVYQGR